MATLESLEQRIVALEQEVTRLRAELHLTNTPQQLNVESRGARLIRKAEEGQPALVASWEKLKKDLGIQGQPIGAKKLRELLIADGMDPNDNAFSRELIAMREE